ncbi:mRNA export factor GLE1 [Euphorbia lathyris]|uniref:mRNA export factor GLE1 n=1 Tax=Euphorbia lathyris TaxID=212925 RepID=UPI0033134CB2
MGVVNLEIRCPPKVNAITADPDPDWSFNSLLLELNALEKKLNASSQVPVPFIKTQIGDFSSRKNMGRKSNAFVVHVSDAELEDSEGDDDEELGHGSLVAKRFNCDDIYLSESDDSDYDLCLDDQSYLMDKVGMSEGAVFELTQEHQLGVKEEIRNKISELEMELMRESEKSDSAFRRVEKYREARKESERKFDTQYQRKMAEALDEYMTAIQRDQDIKLQIEERRIRSDAAYEEAKRKEKALQEERLYQERLRAEAEAKRKAEEAKMVALEAERKAAKEAAEKEAAAKRVTAVVPQGDLAGPQLNPSSGNQNLQKGSRSNGHNKTGSSGTVVKAAESALILEQERLKKLKTLDEENQRLKSSSNMGFSNYESHVARLIRQVRGSKDSVRAKSTELVKIFTNPSCPQSISIAAFVKKVVSGCETPDSSAAFACGYVIVLVTSQIPHAMEILLAEFHKACIYTVPKHIAYSKSAFESKEAYFRTLGYQDLDGKLESTEDYLKRLTSYMKFYAALIQTEVPGVLNLHGAKEGWAWLARFLNDLPANTYTAHALNAFLQTAGFVLFRRYKSQFRKILKIVSEDFLKALREQKDSELNPIILEIQSYIEDNKFLQEPEGRSLQTALLSNAMIPESESSRNFHRY